MSKYSDEILERATQALVRSAGLSDSELGVFRDELRKDAVAVLDAVGFAELMEQVVRDGKTISRMQNIATATAASNRLVVDLLKNEIEELRNR